MDPVIRDDLSNKLIHLTRDQGEILAADILLKIIAEKRLCGGIGNIKGGYRCICFCEAPISKLAQILAEKPANKIRYEPFGIMVDKSWLFIRGGRPVIYQTDGEYELLHETQRFRHVRYDPNLDNPIDFTWEREWRIRTDELPLDPSTAIIVIPNRQWEDYIINKHSIISIKFDTWITDRIPLNVSEQRPIWHVIVLEDLGIPITSTKPPS
jgi:hypothetical protein